MRTIRRLATLTLTMSAAMLSYAAAEAQSTNPPVNAPAQRGQTGFADLVARLAPAVVNISTEQSIRNEGRSFFPPGFEDFFRQFGFPVPDQGRPVTRRGTSLGSGFLISADGYVVTNNHVISPSASGGRVDQIKVTLADRREFSARVIGRDEVSDIAVLKIDATGLPFVRFGNSNGIRVGDWTVAIGNPFGLGGTVTAGIVSALHRNLRAGPYDRFIQTDASINRGNSGGPMFDLNGNVIGITSAIVSPTGGNVGLGFAIPADQARPIIDALRRGERIRRSYIGVTIQPVDDRLASALGVQANRGDIVAEVTPGAPAARAGIRSGDVIVGVEGRPVGPDQSLPYLLSQYQVGSRVRIDLIRDGRPQSVTVTLADRPSEQQLSGRSTDEDVLDNEETTRGTSSQDLVWDKLGLRLRTVTPALARALGIADGDLRAVAVTNVDPDGPAGEEGLRRGDVILAIDRRATPTPEAAARAVADAVARRARSVLVLVRRGNAQPRYVGVRVSSGD